MGGGDGGARESEGRGPQRCRCVSPGFPVVQCSANCATQGLSPEASHLETYGYPQAKARELRTEREGEGNKEKEKV